MIRKAILRRKDSSQAGNDRQVVRRKGLPYHAD
jgi:hypothetical protein